MEPAHSPGVIPKKRDGLVHYHSKRLYLDGKSKLIFLLIIVVYSVTTIMIPFASLSLFNYISNGTESPNSTESDKKLKNEYEAAVFLLGIHSALWFLTLLILCVTLWNCNAKQYVDCWISWKVALACGCMFLFYDLCSVGSSYFCHFPAELITVTICSCCCQNVWQIVTGYVQLTFCKCKRCNHLKDVKLRYSNQSIEIIETQEITAEFLLKNFDFPDFSDSCLAVQIENGRIIHTFNTTDSSVSLYEGRYNIIMRSNTDVQIRYLTGNVSKPVWTKFNENLLKQWLNISTNGTIAIQNEETDRIAHIFSSDTEGITLAKGYYVVKIMHMEPEAENCVARKTIQHSNGETQKHVDCTILNVD